MTTLANDKTEYISVEEFKELSRRGTGTSSKPKARSDAESVPKLTEGEILRQIRDFLRLNGWMVVRIHQSLGSERGIPDLIAIRGGRVCWIEVKTAKGKLSKYQERFLQNLEDHGGWWIVARSVEDVEHLGPRESGGDRRG